jgi:hypothetical protein
VSGWPAPNPLGLGAAEVPRACGRPRHLQQRWDERRTACT